MVVLELAFLECMVYFANESLLGRKDGIDHIISERLRMKKIVVS